MKFAIIAAGEGSRLSSEGIALPKPLVKVCGEHLLDRLIRIFASHDAEEILVICNEQAVAVQEHLLSLEKDGLNSKHLPLRHIVKTTPSSMHSFAELAELLDNEPFVLTTVDTIFCEKDFDSYLRCFSSAIENGEADGVMGVTSYIDDEKPLYIRTTDDTTTALEGTEMQRIAAFLDSDEAHECSVISGGIYGLTAPALKVLKGCMERGVSRMRNFQRALIEDDQVILAYPFGKILDIDHASDIEKAELFLTEEADNQCVTNAKKEK